jgi:hypothetical protein
MPLPATSTPTAAMPTPTQRPIEYPTPTPTPDYLLALARIVDSAAAAAGWLWFLIGSLVFFAAAGLIAGLGFHQQERRRFELFESADETFDFEIPPDEGERHAPGDDDDWPASLP